MPERQTPQAPNMWALAGIVILIALIFAAATIYASTSTPVAKTTPAAPVQAEGPVTLPAPDHASGSTLDYALEHRRSSRAYLNDSISLQGLSLLLWSAQGITEPSSGKRTAPSPMHTYPVTLYVAISNVSGVSPGMYAYVPDTHSLSPYLDASGKDRVLRAIGQRAQSAPVTFVLVGNSSVFTSRGQSPETALRHLCLEAGHIVQNLLLMETSRGMAGVPFTGFNMTAVDDELDLSGDNHVVYAVTAAYPKDQ